MINITLTIILTISLRCCRLLSIVVVVLIDGGRVGLLFSLLLSSSSLIPTQHCHHHQVHHLALCAIFFTLHRHLLTAQLIFPLSVLLVSSGLALSLLSLRLVLKHHVVHHISKEGSIVIVVLTSTCLPWVLQGLL